MLIFLVAFVLYFVKNLNSFKPLLDVSILSLLIIGFTKLSMSAVNGFFTKWTVEVFTKRIPALEAIYIAILSAIGNFFGPLLGGATIRAVYLKKVHKLSYSYFTSTLAGYYVIVFAANSLLAIISLLFLHKSSYSAGLVLFFSLWLLAMIVLMFLRLPGRERLARFESNKLLKFFLTVLYDIENGWHMLMKRRKLVGKLAILALAGFVVTFVNGLVEFHAIRASISMAGLGLYTAISTSSMLVSLTLERLVYERLYCY